MLAIAFAGLALAAPTAAHASTSNASHTLDLSGPGHHVHTAVNGESDVNACADNTAPGTAHCMARVRTQSGITPFVLGVSGAYDPSYLQSAYNAPSSTNGSGRTIAIVDAYDNPNAEADLAAYRSFWGLPACTTANGCFRKVNQSGGTTYPAFNSGWSLEIALDVDMVSAICPKCNILLVEATSSSSVNLGTAVNRAVTMGADAVSNSWGTADFAGSSSYDFYFNHPGVPITVSSGDDGYGASWPASSKYVVAVGGTSLNQTTHNGTRNATETAWTGAGSGCSVDAPKPAWQVDGGCSSRAIADVSAVADPATPVWVYNSNSGGTWYTVGGTSAS
ncbi:MAG TPA: hypothetical protein VL856_12640, partial [Acidimicrobiia bacterium]|nr:hypothetical protein [Acidimicrobiia bacterium]